ncbi:Accessory Sec system protein translocase subunit SecY2 [Limosilactobacillus reuteri]|nr:Accessory Sec system protein translocase subunit SecY2 [Limosilactobacillus reuteri]
MDRLSERRKDWISKEITLLLTVIQGFVLVSSMQLTQTGWAAKGAVLLTMTTGTMFIMWLSNMNALLGIGGLTLLVLANILQSAMKTGLAGILMLADHSTTRLMVVVAALVIIMVLFAYLNVMADRGEYRLPLVRLMIDNNYASRSYLPIKLTPPAGCRSCLPCR